MINRIDVNFPALVELPEGFEQELSALIDKVCVAYEKQHPGRVMWPAGHGYKPIWNEPHEPTFDDSCYQIDCCEREDYDKR